MIEREKLIPVTSEDQLKAGLLVETRPCNCCRVPHRYMLLGREPEDTICLVACGFCRGWRREPLPACAKGPGAMFCPARAIATGRLFIVDTGLEDEKPAQVERPRPLERVR